MKKRVTRSQSFENYDISPALSGVDALDWELIENVNPTKLCQKDGLKTMKTIAYQFITMKSVPLRNSKLVIKLLQILQVIIEFFLKKKDVFESDANPYDRSLNYMFDDSNLSNSYNNVYNQNNHKVIIGVQCPLCSKLFKSIHYVDKHIGKVHPNIFHIWENLRKLSSTNSSLNEQKVYEGFRNNFSRRRRNSSVYYNQPILPNHENMTDLRSITKEEPTGNIQTARLYNSMNSLQKMNSNSDSENNHSQPFERRSFRNIQSKKALPKRRPDSFNAGNKKPLIPLLNLSQVNSNNPINFDNQANKFNSSDNYSEVEENSEHNEFDDELNETIKTKTDFPKQSFNNEQRPLSARSRLNQINRGSRSSMPIVDNSHTFSPPKEEEYQKSVRRHSRATSMANSPFSDSQTMAAPNSPSEIIVPRKPSETPSVRRVIPVPVTSRDKKPTEIINDNFLTPVASPNCDENNRKNLENNNGALGIVNRSDFSPPPKTNNPISPFVFVDSDTDESCSDEITVTTHNNTNNNNINNCTNNSTNNNNINSNSNGSFTMSSSGVNDSGNATNKTLSEVSSVSKKETKKEKKKEFNIHQKNDENNQKIEKNENESHSTLSNSPSARKRKRRKDNEPQKMTEITIKKVGVDEDLLMESVSSINSESENGVEVDFNPKKKVSDTGNTSVRQKRKRRKSKANLNE
ncbi:hypothetical protein TRFO_12072 [Tritrichomonas foetus]|uniref:C2H2-type domain-containing protein n=1 Tax=Tritrichomonas foetus TaxID=1144522 RepID=A0A1J4J5Y4_9EUKA|nr:hypothetical protein TRFO_12072 [Tritrichomonas foetus]|eukprot:OHS93059.1 hypothetical protein TRFO_12072 [Tritrichomonas foetus]